MALVLKKIKATTLVETLVSMTIISLVAGMAMLIFWQVSSPGSSIRELLLAQQKSGELVDELIRENGVYERTLLYSNLSFEQRLVDLGDNLKQVEIDVFDNQGKRVYHRKRVFYAKPAF